MKRNIALIMISLCFLMSSEQLNGQVVRLTKVISGGGIPPGTEPTGSYGIHNDLSLDCLQGTENSFDFEITFQNIGFNATLVITNVSFSSQATELSLNEPEFPMTVSPSEGAIFSVSHTNNWNSLNSSGVQFNLIVDYTISMGNTSTAGSDVFDFNVDICSESPIYLPHDQTIKSPVTGSDYEAKGREKAISEDILISPNPTEGAFQVSYSLEEDASVDITIYNSIGQQVKSILNNEQKEKGTYQINDDLPDYLDSGIYYIVFRVGDEMRTERLVKL